MLDLSWHFCVWTVAEWNNSGLLDIDVYIVMVVPLVRGAQATLMGCSVECHAVGVPVCVEEKPSSLTGL